MAIRLLKITVGAVATLAGIGAFVINVMRNLSTVPKIVEPAPILPTLHISEWK
jgi:hypothetical protein